MVRLDGDDWETLDRRKFLLYGGGFTIAVDLLLYPLELLKTRVQVEAKVRSASGLPPPAAARPLKFAA
jgi:hypothetical protein